MAARHRLVAGGATLTFLLGACASAGQPGQPGASSMAVVAASTTTTAVPIARDEVSEFLDRLIGETGALGGIVAVQRADAGPVVSVAGQTGARPPGDVDREAHWRIASVTKSFVGALALVLADEGVVDLDAPLDRLLPDFPNADRLSLRALLQHTSGLADFDSDPGGSVPIGPLLVPFDREFTTAEALDATEPLARALDPGRGPRYSNANYVIAGAALEAAADAPLGELFEERLFVPLGLSATWYLPNGPVGAAPVGGLDDLGGGATIPSESVPRTSLVTLLGPAAGAVSNLDDMLHWADVVYRSRAVGETDLSPMLDVSPGGYGLGVAGVSDAGTCIFDGCGPNASFERFTLSGDGPGASTRIWFDPASDTIVVVYLNRNSLSLDEPIAVFLDEGVGFAAPLAPLGVR